MLIPLKTVCFVGGIDSADVTMQFLLAGASVMQVHLISIIQ